MILLSTIQDRLRADGLLAGGVLASGALSGGGGRKDLKIQRVVYDSRDVGPGDCFVAIRGGSIDGHLFLDKAVYNGAIAIVCEAASDYSGEGSSDVALVRVTNGRQALLSLASEFYGNPGHDLAMIGVTGTNGKTTVATLVAHTLNTLGQACGFIGTTGYSFSGINYSSTATTPAPTDVYRLLSEMRDTGAVACSMEVSSHALDQYRVRVADFNVAVFTNLTRDHLDYHGTRSGYLEAKKKLFDGLNVSSTAILNLADPASSMMASDSNAKCLYYGGDKNADIRYRILEDDRHGLKLELDGQQATFQLSGAFNADNIAAAYGAGIGLGLAGNDLIAALSDAPPVRGRFELIPVSRERSVIIDYAHTPDALENALKEARARTPDESSLWCVFGCGGDRDTGKRPLMGEIADRLSDRVVITDDNPRTEDSGLILKGILDGIPNSKGVICEADRAAAIRAAAEESEPGDVILIAGKGHETVQVIGTDRIPFDDREIAIDLFGLANGLGDEEKNGVSRG